MCKSNPRFFFAVQSTHFLKLSFQKDLHGLLVIKLSNHFSNPDPKPSMGRLYIYLHEIYKHFHHSSRYIYQIYHFDGWFWVMEFVVFFRNFQKTIPKRKGHIPPPGHMLVEFPAGLGQSSGTPATVVLSPMWRWAREWCISLGCWGAVFLLTYHPVI